MKNVYPFVQNPCPLANLRSSPIYRIMEKLNGGGKLNTGKDDGFDGFKHKDEKGNYCTRESYARAENDYVCFDELWHPDAYRNGIYKLMGYVFDFRAHFKTYLVKWKHYGWQEHFAPNKSFIINNAICKNEIIKIIELPRPERSAH